MVSETASPQRIRYSFTPKHLIEGRFRTLSPKEPALYNMHYEVELGIVVRGTLRFDSPKNSLVLQPGDVWLSRIWEPHRVVVLDTPCTIALLLIWPDLVLSPNPFAQGMGSWLAPFLSPSQTRPRIAPSHRPHLIRIARSIGQTLAKKTSNIESWLLLRLVESLLWCNENWKPSSQPPKKSFAPGELQPAIEKVFQSNEFITTGEAARICGLNRNSFSQRFIQAFQMPFSDFALKHRLSAAATDLIQQDLPIKAISTRWGFRDVSHFHRAFTKHFMCSPHFYRETQQHSQNRQNQ